MTQKSLSEKKLSKQSIILYENNEKGQWMYKKSSYNKNNTREGSSRNDQFLLCHKLKFL